MGAEFEFAKKAKELSDLGLPRSQIVREVNHDEIWVAKSIDIMTKLPAEAIAMYGQGDLSRQAAEQLAMQSQEKIAAIWERAKELNS